MSTQLPVISGEAPLLPPLFHVVVDFGPGFDADTQARGLLAFEKALRAMGAPAEVFKRTMEDDSKLRRSMTAEQRSRL